MLKRQHRTERIVAVSIAIVVVEIEGTRVAIAGITATIEERIATSRKVRVRYSLIPYFFIFLFFICTEKRDLGSRSHIKVLKRQHRTERIGAVSIATVVVETEGTRVAIAGITATTEERIATRRKVRVR